MARQFFDEQTVKKKNMPNYIFNKFEFKHFFVRSLCTVKSNVLFIFKLIFLTVYKNIFWEF